MPDNDTRSAPSGATLTERVEAKAAEALDHAARSKRLPWWHRKRRHHMRAADKAIREGFAMLTEGPRS